VEPLGLAVGKRSRTARVATREEALALDLFGDEPWEFVAVAIDAATGRPDPAAVAALGCSLEDEEEPPPLRPRRERFTPAAYLLRERAAREKSEYWDGEVVAMAGAPRTHNVIATNATAALWHQLAGRPCEVYRADMRVRADWANGFAYPDVVVVCGEPRFQDAREDVLLNPTVLVEVLSPSTERRDRGPKAAAYRAIPPLREYVLVAQEPCRVELHRREADGAWSTTLLQRPDDVLALRSIGCEVPLSTLYRGVRPAPAAGSQSRNNRDA
jgi:Uma2 family endonuclease